MSTTPRPAAASPRNALIASVVVVALFTALSGFGGFLLGIAIIAIGTSGFVLLTRRQSWARISSRRVAAGILAGGLVLAVLSSAFLPRERPHTADVVAIESAPTEAGVSRAPSETPSRPPTESPRPVPTATVPPSAPPVAPVPLVDVPVAEAPVAEAPVVEAPIVEAPVVEAPVAEAPPPAEPSCDPNYSGACVPLASDVDCAGGSGNGPAYVAGPVYVVGSDVYDLDRDGDGVACDA